MIGNRRLPPGDMIPNSDQDPSGRVWPVVVDIGLGKHLRGILVWDDAEISFELPSVPSIAREGTE